MEITQLIELVYWMLIVFGVLFGIAFVIALWVIITGFRRVLKKEILLDGEEISKPVYRDPNPAKTISKYSKERE